MGNEDRLMKLAAEKGINQLEDLDEMVHDLASQQASAVNNAGLDTQIRFIKTHGGEEALKEVEEIINKSR